MRYLLEGGNVFKGPKGEPLTQRINRQDVPATIQWIEQVTGIDFSTDLGEDGVPLRWLGSTGKAPSSGDLDLAVDLNEASREQVESILKQFVQSQGLDPREYVVKKGEKGEVHLKTPIAGDANRGFVQTDFMFFENLDWGQFFYAGGTGSAYKGKNRNVLMSSIAKQLGLKVGSNGMFSRTTNELVQGGLDPDYVARVLLGSGATRANLKNVESIYAALAKDPNRDAKLADFRGYLAGEGLQEPEQTVKEGDAYFLARLRDRIVNRGYVALVEHQRPVIEAAEAGVGGRAKGIEHLEDYVFRQGAPGIQKALDIVKHSTEAPKKTTTAKWDGKPAVIFGRKPDTGEFVLTDGSGFDAKGYDGLATSPQMMADIQNTRSGDRTELIQIYATLFPVLEAALPPNFRGYVKGDLLFMQTPPVIAGNYVFKPNTIEYRIPVRSAMGQRISGNPEAGVEPAQIGIAIHSMYADQGEPRQPLRGVSFNPVPGLLLEKPASPETLETETNIEKELRQIIRTQGAAMRTLFNPAELRAQQITNLFQLAVDFINTKVGAPLQSAQELLEDFGPWLLQKAGPRKYNNIVEYLNSPTTNAQALAASFRAFELLHALKVHLKTQADVANPGGEGWVMATPAGYAKLVSRFDPQGFTGQNRAQNNPQPQ
jgi:hypothetical protein